MDDLEVLYNQEIDQWQLYDQWVEEQFKTIKTNQDENYEIIFNNLFAELDI